MEGVESDGGTRGDIAPKIVTTGINKVVGDTGTDIYDEHLVPLMLAIGTDGCCKTVGSEGGRGGIVVDKGNWGYARHKLHQWKRKREELPLQFLRQGNHRRQDAPTERILGTKKLGVYETIGNEMFEQLIKIELHFQI